jgi:hypothetical protein
MVTKISIKKMNVWCLKYLTKEEEDQNSQQYHKINVSLV